MESDSLICTGSIHHQFMTVIFQFKTFASSRSSKYNTVSFIICIYISIIYRLHIIIFRINQILDVLFHSPSLTTIIFRFFLQFIHSYIYLTNICCVKYTVFFNHGQRCCFNISYIRVYCFFIVRIPCIRVPLRFNLQPHPISKKPFVSFL